MVRLRQKLEGLAAYCQNKLPVVEFLYGVLQCLMDNYQFRYSVLISEFQNQIKNDSLISKESISSLEQSKFMEGNRIIGRLAYKLETT
jgi:hypothetical protein